MLKNMKKTILIILIVVVSAGIGVFAAFQSKGKKITLPSEEEIAMLQLNRGRIVPGKYDNYDLWEMKRIKENIEKTKPLSKQEAIKHKLDGKPYVLGLLYENGERYFFNFYKDGEHWFMKTKDGNVYGNADFVEKYVPEKNEAISDGNSGETTEGTFTYEFNFSSELYEYGEKTNFDIRYLFASTMNSYRDSMTFDEAIDMTMLMLPGSRFLYQYAIDHGCEATEEELEKGYLEVYMLLPEEQKAEFEKQLTAALQKEGISREVYNKCVRESDKARFAMAKLDQKKEQEFMDGTDYLEDAEYRFASDYAIAFRNYLMNVASKSPKYKDVMKKINKEVEDAKEAYIEYFGTEGFLEEKEKNEELEEMVKKMKELEKEVENKANMWEIDEYLEPWIGKWVSEDSTLIVYDNGTCELDGETYEFTYTKGTNGTFQIRELIKDNLTSQEYREIAHGCMKDGKLWLERSFGKKGEAYYTLETKETNEK